MPQRRIVSRCGNWIELSPFLVASAHRPGSHAAQGVANMASISANPIAFRTVTQEDEKDRFRSAR